MTQPISIMIFAAGHGTRMRPLTDHAPKPLIKVAGKALIDHAMDIVTPANLTVQVVNLHYKAAMLRDHLADTGVQFSDEENQLLETGGGLRHALPLLGQNPVFTLNTDAVWRGKNPLKQLAQAWDPARMDALLLLIQPQNATGHSGQGGLFHGRSRPPYTRQRLHIFRGHRSSKQIAYMKFQTPAFP